VHPEAFIDCPCSEESIFLCNGKTNVKNHA
jgi:hypothetical protein